MNLIRIVMLLHCKNANSSTWYQYDMTKMNNIEKSREENEFKLVAIFFAILKFIPFAFSFMILLQCLFLSTQLLIVIAKNNNN